MIADTIVDAKAGHHWAKPNSPQVRWMQYIDRAWLEGVLYHADDQTSASTPSSSKDAADAAHDYAGIRQLLTFEGKVRQKTVAVILADVDSASWILNAAPFPTVKREPRTGEMFHVKDDGVTSTVSRSFFGTFETKGGLKRRRVASPSPQTVRPSRKALAQRKGRLSKVAVGEDELQ